MIDYPLAGKRVWVAGQTGMVGSAIVRRLQAENCEVMDGGRNKLDLLDQEQTRAWVAHNKPDAVFFAAARVGGILANDNYPADFLYDNLVIETNIIDAAWRAGVGKLLFLGSSCIYPKFAPQPMPEESLLTGPLEPTNQWYAIAKIAGIKLCQAYRAQHGCNFISAMPTNLYGPEDNFNLSSSHVIPALIRKAHDAKKSGADEMVIWGTGKPRREFLHVDDCADALVFLMKTYSGDMHINVGSGEDISIQKLAHLVTSVTGFTGRIVHDITKPDGTPRKLMAIDRLLGLGWAPQIKLPDGLAATYSWFLKNAERFRR